MGASGTWHVEHRSGDAQELHQREPLPEGRQLLVHHVQAPAVVLGSAQAVEGIDERAASLGLDVARRRSGGGAVLLVPGAQVWVDLVVPSGDELWDDDVERATWWVGEAWARVVDRLSGDGAPVLVHRRGLEDRELGRVVCFASLGPGEVERGGRKVVGISQRRTRAYERFQCLMYLQWQPAPLLEVLGAVGNPALAHALAERAAAVSVPEAWSVVEELGRQLP